MEKENDKIKTEVKIYEEIKKIKELRGKDSVKSHLQSLGFLPGENIEVIAENPSGIILLIKSTRIAINRAMANKIVVE